MYVLNWRASWMAKMPATAPSVEPSTKEPSTLNFRDPSAGGIHRCETDFQTAPESRRHQCHPCEGQPIRAVSRDKGEKYAQLFQLPAGIENRPGQVPSAMDNL
ncbi:hypothetical protein NL676_033508 [Syzygium grande]|nr:hypothetical protein NL676_033508 [Syzygium grande]